MLACILLFGSIAVAGAGILGGSIYGIVSRTRGGSSSSGVIE